MSELGMRVRLVLSGTVLLLAITGMLANLAFLQLGAEQDTRERIDQKRQVEEKLLPGRGNIYDRNGKQNILALNMPVQDVCADPSLIIKTNRLEQTALKLAQNLDVPPEQVTNSLLARADKRFTYVLRFVEEDKAQDVMKQKLPGVFCREGITRYYPQASLMSHVLGFVNHEGTGSAGIEQCMDRYLRGVEGIAQSRVNALGQKMYWSEGRYVAPLSGADVYLNLDQNVQHIVECALDEVMAEHNPRGAWAIVQRVKTGEILAMASRPAYDPNSFSDAETPTTLNRAIGCVYEPGSTFKALTIAAALNERTVTPETVFDCENGSWLYGKRALRDFHAYGKLTVADGLKKSSNILNAKVALTLGDQRFHRYMKAFGIGGKTGVDLPGEELGILHPVSKWSTISATRIAIGQGVAVTALQLLGVYCAIANDGYMMKPFVVNRVVAANGAVLMQPQPEVIARPITAETAATMRKLLSRVTEDGGTGTRAQVDGYEVAGKTGSAQKPEAGGYSSTAYVASFVGFLPAESPEVGIVVVVDEPQPVHLGGVVAGPAFSRIAGQTVRYLDIPPVQYKVARSE